MTTEELMHAICYEWPCPFELNGELRWMAPDGTILPGRVKLSSVMDDATYRSVRAHHVAMETLRAREKWGPRNEQREGPAGQFYGEEG